MLSVFFWIGNLPVIHADPALRRFPSGKGRAHVARGVGLVGEAVLHLEQDGRKVALDPSSFHPAGKGLSLSTPAEIEVRAGDRLIWTANDKARGMVNGAGVEVKSVENGVVTLDDNGREHRLEPGDPALRRLDHGAVLNMHRAQGITVDTAITVMSSEDRLLNSRSLLYVLASRSRDDLTSTSTTRSAWPIALPIVMAYRSTHSISLPIGSIREVIASVLIPAS